MRITFECLKIDFFTFHLFWGNLLFFRKGVISGGGFIWKFLLKYEIEKEMGWQRAKDRFKWKRSVY